MRQTSGPWQGSRSRAQRVASAPGSSSTLKPASGGEGKARGGGGRVEVVGVGEEKEGGWGGSEIGAKGEWGWWISSHYELDRRAACLWKMRDACVWDVERYEPASIFAVWGVFILLLVSPLSFSTFRVFVLCPMNPLQGSRASKRSHCGAVRILKLPDEPSAGILRAQALSLWRRANS